MAMYDKKSVEDLDVAYIISSVNTLGVTEDEVLKRGEMLIADVIKAERALREEIATNQKDQSEDIYGRSYGTLKYAGMISRSEALQALGWLRLYHEYDDSGDIKVSCNTINKLTMDILWEPDAPSKKSSQSAASQKSYALTHINPIVFRVFPTLISRQTRYIAPIPTLTTTILKP